MRARASLIYDLPGGEKFNPPRNYYAPLVEPGLHRILRPTDLLRKMFLVVVFLKSSKNQLEA